MADVLLIPNLGAEEEGDWRPRLREPIPSAVVKLWRLLFGPGSRVLGADPAWEWPAALGEAPSRPVFPWLERPGQATAWLNTAAASRDADEAGCPLAGPPVQSVARVHDKAFAARVAREADLVPEPLRDAIHVLSPETLRDTPAAVREIRAHLDRWPSALAGRFTLKPRFGTSGRGRVAGEAARAGASLVRGALARLAARGGAVLEPWLERHTDLSAQLFLDAEGGLVLLGTLEQRLTPAGVFLGHRGTVDTRGRVTSGTPFDEELRQAAAQLASAARQEGFAGPCGLDAFSFALGGRIVLRPVVEFNGRFTTGTIAIGLVRLALPAIKRRLRPSPEQRLAFHLALDAPDSGWPEGDADRDCLFFPLWHPGDAARPGLLVGRDPESLDRALNASALESPGAQRTIGEVIERRGLP